MSWDSENSVEVETVRGVPVPEEVAGFVRGDSIDNEANTPGLGTTVPFASANAKATVYIYDQGLEEIPEGPTSDVLLRHFDQTIGDIHNAIRQGAWESVKLTETYVTGNPVSGAEFLCAELRLHHGGREFDSFLYLTGYNSQFVKIRLTAPSELKMGDVAREFADELARVFWPRSESTN